MNDANTPRPIVAGGTGATTAADARTNLGVAIGTDVQAYDADLAAVAGLSSNGIVTRTGAGTAAARTITAGAGISVTNGDGVSGNPTIAASGITTAEIAAATLVTASETIGSNNNDTTIPTSAAVKAYADAAGVTWNYTSTGQTFSTTQTTVNHGLGAVPSDFMVTIRCVANDAATGYNSGDEIPLASFMDGDGARAAALWATSTQIGLRLISTSLVPKASGGMTAPTATTNFQMFFKARL